MHGAQYAMVWYAVYLIQHNQAQHSANAMHLDAKQCRTMHMVAQPGADARTQSPYSAIALPMQCNAKQCKPMHIAAQPSPNARTRSPNSAIALPMQCNAMRCKAVQAYAYGSSTQLRCKSPSTKQCR
jgi:hypothetical protein